MEDPTTVINHCQTMMMMSSEANPNGDGLLNNLVDPTDFFKFGNTQIMNNLSGANEHVSWHDMNVIMKEVKSELPDIQHPNSSNWRSSIASPPSGQLISFGSTNCEVKGGTIDLNQSIGREKRKERVGGAISTTLCPQEHVLAERKRREKLTQRFLALSALIPGLSKVHDHI